MVLTTCTWCDEEKENRKIKGDTTKIPFGKPIYGVCDWCRKNHVPMHCSECLKVFSITNMLKTRNLNNDGKFVFCCKTPKCIEEFKLQLHKFHEAQQPRL